jgi:hypothetical protein
MVFYLRVLGPGRYLIAYRYKILDRAGDHVVMKTFVTVVKMKV